MNHLQKDCDSSSRICVPTIQPVLTQCIVISSMCEVASIPGFLLLSCCGTDARCEPGTGVNERMNEWMNEVTGANKYATAFSCGYRSWWQRIGYINVVLPNGRLKERQIYGVVRFAPRFTVSTIINIVASVVGPSTHDLLLRARSLIVLFFYVIRRRVTVRLPHFWDASGFVRLFYISSKKRFFRISVKNILDF